MHSIWLDLSRGISDSLAGALADRNGDGDADDAGGDGDADSDGDAW
jgi:hypothetical protein